MKKFILYSPLLIAFILSGCVTRVIPYEVNRVDQEIKGNRGIVRGKVPPAPETKTKKTKTLYNVEIELSDFTEGKKSKEEDIHLEGNRGYIQTVKKVKGITRLEPFTASTVAPQVIVEKSTLPGMKYEKEGGRGKLINKPQKIYVVQKGDTLQKISEEMYGTIKKWKKIFEANRDILKSPDMIRPGQKLVIPEE